MKTFSLTVKKSRFDFYILKMMLKKTGGLDIKLEEKNLYNL